jgi:hypothetical protein
MKKNMIKKILILTPLLLGLVACKEKGKKEPSFFDEPEITNVKRGLNNVEMDNLLLDVIDKLNDAIEIENRSKGMETYFDGSSTIMEKTQKGNIYENCSFSAITVEKMKEISPSGLPIVDEETTMISDAFWKNDIFYAVFGEGENGNIDYEFMRVPASIHEAEHMFGGLFDDAEFLYGLMTDYYLDVNGNYRSYIEHRHYQTRQVGNEFVHFCIRVLNSVEINPKFEINHIFMSETFYEGTFKDQKRKSLSELTRLEDNYFYDVYHFKYGTKKAMPNIDERITSFPNTIIKDDAVNIKYKINYCEFNEETQSVEVQEGIQIESGSGYLEAFTNLLGGAYGSVFALDVLELEKNQAVRIDFNFTAYKNGLLEWADYTEHDVNVDFSVGLSDELRELLVRVEQDDVVYLAYAPDPSIEAPDSIYLSAAFDFLITPKRDEMLNPSGDVEISNIDIFVNKFVIA